MPRRRRLAGALLDGGIELLDMGHARLVPPPFHRPPTDARLIRNRAQAFQFEQRAADRHLLVEAELDELLEAVDLILAAHDVDEHLWPEGLGLDEIGGVIDRAERN